MKILITGGAGFIGANLVARLAADGGHEIAVYDNESTGSRRDVADFDVRFVRADVLDRDALRAAMKGQDVVVHLAADTGVIGSIKEPRTGLETNAVGTFNVLEAARENGVARVINASTGGAILGEAEPPVHEEMVARPLSPYGASKLAAEGYVNAFAASYGMDCASLRFSNVFGPRSYHKGSVVAHFFKQIMSGEELTVFGDGTQVRDYLFVEDLADGLVRAVGQGVRGVYQLGSGRPTTLNDLIGLMRRVTGRDFAVGYRDFRPGEIRATWCNIAKAQRTFGFSPATPLDEGLARTWAWFRRWADA